MSDIHSPTAFLFPVSFAGADADAGAASGVALSEVAGLSAANPDGDNIVGDGPFVLRLPKPVRHTNLTLKRGDLPVNGPYAT